jgi:1,4-dihydroxy-2-naphthoate octaprenyltransferase
VGVWRLADPKITLASAASLLLGASAAAADGPIAWGWLVLTVAGIFFVEVAKNVSGEVFDFDSGADRAVAPEDRSPFSGGSAAARRLWREPSRTARVVPAQAWTLWSFLLLAAGVSLGLLIGAAAPR